MKQKLVHLARLATMCCLMIFAFGGNAFAQSFSVKGKIIDNAGQPVIGAGVTISGTTNGVAADLDGFFQITVPSETTVLTVSALGYAAKDVEIGKKQNLVVVLDDEAESLEATVVVAYGTQTKATVTGALATIDSVRAITSLLRSSKPSISAASSTLFVTISARLSPWRMMGQRIPRDIVPTLRSFVSINITPLKLKYLIYILPQNYL